MSFNSSLNPDVVKTKLDKVFYQEFDGERHPGHFDATNSKIFNQDSADSSAIIMEIFGGVGAWESTNEEENLPNGNPRITNEITFNVEKFAKKVDIPLEFFDDNKHGSYEKMVRNFARRARTARDKNAMSVFREATTQTTADGSAIIADDHTTISGDTVDNKITTALSPSSLSDAIKMMYEQKAQDGEIDGHVPASLVVPPALYDYAVEITDSKLLADTADNNVNPYSTKYMISVYTSPFLGAAAGGDDNNWFLLSNTHSLTRWVRSGVSTSLVDANISDNDVYKYKGRFREVVGVPSYEGIIGAIVA